MWDIIGEITDSWLLRQYLLTPRLPETEFFAIGNRDKCSGKQRQPDHMKIQSGDLSRVWARFVFFVGRHERRSENSFQLPSFCALDAAITREITGDGSQFPKSLRC